jgi:hypothetical protein
LKAPTGTEIAERAPTPDPAADPVRPYPPLVIGDDAPEVTTAPAMSPSPTEAHSSIEDIKEAFHT